MKLCRKCLNSKPESEFGITNKISKKTGKPYLTSRCRPCLRIMSRKYSSSPAYKETRAKYLEENGEARKIKSREAYQNASPEEKQRRIKIQREWQAKNREKIKNYRELNRSSKRKYTRLFKNITRRTLNALTVQITKTIGMKPKGFKAYIESKFQTGMSWDNYGEWEIDHIKPLASFDLINTEQLKQANHFSNLQPLWAKDNNTKSNKLEPVI